MSDVVFTIHPPHELVENREGHPSASQVRHLRAEGFRIAAIIVGAVQTAGSALFNLII